MKQNTKIYAVANRKGGVGKTTTVVNLAAGFAKLGNKVLAVDMDYQGDLSYCLGYEDDSYTIAELLLHYVGHRKMNYDDFIAHNEAENVDFIPASDNLEGLASYIATKQDCNNILNNILKDTYFNKYDYIFIDCRPDSDLLVVNALSACDKLIIPVQADVLAFEKVPKILQSLVNVKADEDFANYIIGIIPTMYRKGTKHSLTVLNELKEMYGELVFNTPISFLTEAKNSAGFNVSCVNTKRSRVGIEYMNIVNEIIAREGV